MSARAAIAVVAACGILFGGSYAGAKLTGDDGSRSAQSAPTTRPDSPEGRSLTLAGAAGLPTLRAPHRPKAESTPAPVVVASSPAPAPRYSSSPPAPTQSNGSGGTTAPNQDKQSPSETTANAQPPSKSAPVTQVDDSGG